MATKPTDVFAVMNDAFTADPILIQVPGGATVDAPIVVIHWFTGNGAAVFPRLVVDAGADSQSRVLDVYASDHDGGTGNLVVPFTELGVGPAARLGYVNLQELALTAWQIGSTVARVDRDGNLETTCAGLGAEYARQRTDCHLDGRGATGNLRAVYFGEGQQTLDFRTFQDHAAPDTTSDLLFKGALGGSSRSVYSGLIRVEKNARGTNAFQTNRNIKLSDDAWAESVPNLEILNNDVRCSHASAVGPVDEEQRFYLESRGRPARRGGTADRHRVLRGDPERAPGHRGHRPAAPHSRGQVRQEGAVVSEPAGRANHEHSLSSPRSGEALIGASGFGRAVSWRHPWMVHQ